MPTRVWSRRCFKSSLESVSQRETYWPGTSFTHTNGYEVMNFRTWQQTYTCWGGCHERIYSRPKNVRDAFTTAGLNSDNLHKDKAFTLLPLSISDLLTKLQEPFVVTRWVGGVPLDRCGATQIHLNLLKNGEKQNPFVWWVWWRLEMNWGCRCQAKPFPPPFIGITMSHQPSERMLLHSNMCFAHVFSPLPGHYILEDHHVEMHPGITVSSYR